MGEASDRGSGPEPKSPSDGWSSHAAEQRRAWRRTTARQRLAWLEDAKRFVARVRAVRASRGAAQPRKTRSEPPRG